MYNQRAITQRPASPLSGPTGAGRKSNDGWGVIISRHVLPHDKPNPNQVYDSLHYAIVTAAVIYVVDVALGA